MDERSRYRINVVSEQTGIPEATLRAWERRYRVPMPQRTPSGYRLYSLRDVRQVQQIRALCEAGMSPAEAARRVAEGERGVSDAQATEAESTLRAAQSETLRFVESLQVKSPQGRGLASLADVFELCSKAATVVACRHAARPMLLVESNALHLETLGKHGELVEVVASLREVSAESVRVEVVCTLERLGRGEGALLARALMTLMSHERLTGEA